MDYGVGIFKKIQDYFGYNSIDDAINELFKGKITTDTDNHSGEGIFFTSRLMDQFDEVELDFKDVEEIGQAFAHELFVKFANNNPNIKLSVVNSNQRIDAMINHVKNTR